MKKIKNLRLRKLISYFFWYFANLLANYIIMVNIFYELNKTLGCKSTNQQ